MAARKQILSVGHADGELTLRSPCINPMIKKGWNYSGVNYIVMCVSTTKTLAKYILLLNQIF